MTQQFIDGSEFSGYGASLGWRVALISPKGEVVDATTLGYDNAVPAASLVYGEIREYLQSPTCTWCGADTVVRDVAQMLGLSGLRQWHNFRLAWGDADPNEAYAECPNGRDTKWTLYFCANGRNSVVLTGQLPEGWWEMDEDDQYEYLLN